MPSRRRCDKALWTKIRISRNIRKKCLKWPERLKLQQITVPQTLNRFLTQMQRGIALYKQQASSKESLTEADNKQRTEVFKDVVDRSGVDYLFIMSEKGDVLMSPDNRLTGKNLVDIGMLTKENLGIVSKGTAKKSGEVTPAKENNEYGYYYVYSVRVSHMGRKAVLVLGVRTVFGDSEISGVLNMTQATSFAMCQINIEYGQDIEYVEEVLNIFYKNGIKVPFPHVTVMHKEDD